ncbi:hypothetical protein J7E94_16415 [Streptomyces sp. ISL-94]|nr:hypothetical protein [Streptomyces sp. ISL-94]
MPWKYSRVRRNGEFGSTDCGITEPTVARVRFTARSNRTSETTAAGATRAACPTSGGTTVNHTYDSADRITDSGYTYDAFGRTTALPGTTVGYYNNDLVRQQTIGAKRQTWQLDASLRFRSWTVESNATDTWTQTASKVNHYAADGDSPSWIVEGAQGGGITRIVSSAAGDFAATTNATGATVLQLTNIHGDVALQLPLNTTQAPVALETDEYGNRSSSVSRSGSWTHSWSLRTSRTVLDVLVCRVRSASGDTDRVRGPGMWGRGSSRPRVPGSAWTVRCPRRSLSSWGGAVRRRIGCPWARLPIAMLAAS